MLRTIFLSIVTAGIGAACAVGLLYFLAVSPVRFDNAVMTTFGVQKPEVVGFLPYWLLTKADKQYDKYITTLTYFGLTVNSDGTLQRLSNAQEQEPGWTALMSANMDIKLADAKKKGLKQSLLVISGDDEAISAMMVDPIVSGKNLVAGVGPIMREKGFTDLNLDIETFMKASDSARTNFTTFVRTIKKELTAQELGTLTVDLIPISLVKPKLYDAGAIGKIADRVVLMTYDYHYSGSFTSGANAPIGGSGDSMEFDVETAVKEALKVMPKEKILLGIPLYGYEWETIDEASESATIPGGSSTASVARVSEMLKACASCSSVWDPVSASPHVVVPEGDYFNQIYFENEDSMKAKITLAQKYHLGGVALWALGYEDDKLLTPLEKYKSTLDLSGF